VQQQGDDEQQQHVLDHVRRQHLVIESGNARLQGDQQASHPAQKAGGAANRPAAAHPMDP
jgi:hypothetical protein